MTDRVLNLLTELNGIIDKPRVNDNKINKRWKSYIRELLNIKTLLFND
jgi:hypothetical protein